MGVNWAYGKVWAHILGFMLFQFLLMQLVPGKAYVGPEAVGETTNIPHYCDNGFRCFWISMGILGTALYLRVLDGLWIYQHLGAIYMALNIFGLAFCTFLYLKGKHFTKNWDLRVQPTPEMPNPDMLLKEQNWLLKFYDGVETYPFVKNLPFGLGDCKIEVPKLIRCLTALPINKPFYSNFFPDSSNSRLKKTFFQSTIT